jgi:hypothetical protein
MTARWDRARGEALSDLVTVGGEKCSLKHPVLGRTSNRKFSLIETPNQRALLTVPCGP